SLRGFEVEVIERGRFLGDGCCSWMAGGMLAPWCERANTDAAVLALGEPSIAWWMQHFAGTQRRGSLVVAQPRDAVELTRFRERTEGCDWLDEDAIAQLEPDLAGRFRRALFFPKEAHLDPRAALRALAADLAKCGVAIRFGIDRGEGNFLID